MTADHFGNIEQFNADLWKIADGLRANSNLASNEYFLPIMGLLFLRQATNRYYEALAAIKADQDAGKMAHRTLVEADFLRRRAMMLPEKARFDLILERRKDGSLGKIVTEAMEAVEQKFQPLAGQLPKNYEGLDDGVLENMMRRFDTEALRTAGGDVFGRIYEYFLGEFSKQGAHDNGEFFTPPSLVQTIVNVIEPDHGVILDPACGSGGMFVQSSHFIEDAGQETMKRVTFYGHEKNETTAKLAQINLAVHGLQGSIRAGNEAITYYKDPHELRGKCDFVMANPPFNVDEVDAEKVSGDKRLPFGLPGINKQKKVSNANYLWLTEPSAYAFAERHDNIEAIYKKLTERRDTADVTALLKELHRIVNEAIRTATPGGDQAKGVTFDLSQIDLKKLQDEFGKKVQYKATAVEDIREIVERKLLQMLGRNPTRMDYQQKYEDIVADYNREKSRASVEETFRRLTELVAALDEEQKRAVEEGLSEEELALFDLLKKDNLGKSERERVKQASRELLQSIKTQLAELDHFWEKEQTKADVEVFILDKIFTSLPTPPFTSQEKELVAANVYAHIWQQAMSGSYGS